MFRGSSTNGFGGLRRDDPILHMTAPIDIIWLQKNFPDLSDFRPLAQGGQKIVLAAKHARDGGVVLKIVYSKTDPESV